MSSLQISSLSSSEIQRSQGVVADEEDKKEKEEVSYSKCFTTMMRKTPHLKWTPEHGYIEVDPWGQKAAEE